MCELEKEEKSTDTCDSCSEITAKSECATCEPKDVETCSSCSCQSCSGTEPDASELSRTRNRIIVALVIFFAVFALESFGILEQLFTAKYTLYAEFILFLIPFLIAGYDVLIKAAKNVAKGHGLDENFLMSIATVGAFALVLFPDSEPHMAEGAAVMLFYQVGELFQSYAVGKSRRSIKAMLDITPEYANIMRGGKLEKVSPKEISIDEEIIVKPGERIPLDGIVVDGESQLDTSALTGESLPRTARKGDEVISGCVNLSGTLTIKVTSVFANSTVKRILELVENASEKKARTENFIRRFARYYTPIVVGLAAAIAFIPPILLTIIGATNPDVASSISAAVGIEAGTNIWSDWILRGLTFLVVSCPCALVIAVPLSFFGGIGGASRAGILVKGSNYLEMLSKVDTVVFDKTGTLTSGTFAVTGVFPADSVSFDDSQDLKASTDTLTNASVEALANTPANAPANAPTISKQELLEYAAHAEALSNHPIAVSIQKAFNGALDLTRISSNEEIPGHGIKATIDGSVILAGNDKLMYMHNIAYETHELVGTQVHVAKDGVYLGTVVIGDAIKEDSKSAIEALHKEGVRRTIMPTGDATAVAQAVASELGLDDFRAELLPQDKVSALESIMGSASEANADANANNIENDASINTSKTAFVGDGINDAPVLMRADIGIAMGAMGSDAAIEAADIVLINDHPTQIATAIRIAKRTLRIVKQNIVFALAIKFAVLLLAALGIANMWMAVFADVGVAILAILNAMRAIRIR